MLLGGTLLAYPSESRQEGREVQGAPRIVELPFDFWTLVSTRQGSSLSQDDHDKARLRQVGRQQLWHLARADAESIADQGSGDGIGGCRRPRQQQGVGPDHLGRGGLPGAKHRNAENAAAAWETLRNLYHQRSNAQVLKLKLELASLRKERGESITKYVARARSIGDQLTAAGQPAGDTDIVLAVLAGLPEEYGMLRTVLELADPLPRLDDLLGKLLLIEQRTPSRDNTDKAYFTKGKPSRVGFGGGNQRHDGASSSRMLDKDCFYCGKRGHFKKDCRKRIADEKAGRTKPNVVALTAMESSHTDWILDSGASRHMTGDKHLLVNTKRLPQPVTITYGNGQQGVADTVGDVVVRPDRLMLKDVLYVPGNAVNLMSIKVATAAGAKFNFHQGGCDIVYDGEILATAKGDHGLYTIENGSEPLDAALLAKCAETAELWHTRLGHLGYKNMARMVDKQMVKGINVSPRKFLEADKEACEACLKGKQTRHPFPLSETKTSQPLELVHMDLCGPIEPLSVGQSRYVATFVDDYTGLSVVRPLDYKSKVKDSVMDVLTQMENESGLRVKAVRTDNGSEYINEVLSRFFSEKGIKHEKTVPYTPQQNGKAERLNRTLMEKVRAMLADSSLPKALWGEAIVTATLLRNLSPFKDNEKTPYEMFYGKTPDVARLRTFGCKVYVHTPKEKRGKLDDVGRPGIMVGYAENIKGYRILLNDQESIVISRDVVFDETSRRNKESTIIGDEVNDDNTPEQEATDDSKSADGSDDNDGDNGESGEDHDGRECEPASVLEPEDGPIPPSAPVKRYPSRSRKAPSEWWCTQPTASSFVADITEPSTADKALTGYKAMIEANDISFTRDRGSTTSKARSWKHAIQESHSRHGCAMTTSRPYQRLGTSGVARVWASAHEKVRNTWTTDTQ